MSRPYEFPDKDRVTSPLDRQAPSTLPAAQAPSFKTNVNRNKTRKWVEAPSYSYEGDDWGGYDEHDEYGVDQQPPLPAGSQQPGQASSAARNFTGPAPVMTRQRSFDRGDERRAFSAGPPSALSPTESTDLHPGNRQASVASTAATGVSSPSTVNPENRRDFSPSALPAPLQTSPPGTSHANQPISPVARPPSAGPYDPRSGTPTAPGKALPFVRPADIYKRMEEAREQERRESLDSSRSGAEEAARPRAGSASSLKSTSRERLHDEQSRAGRGTLASVPERKSEYGMLDQQPPPASSLAAKPEAPLQLPKGLGTETFGEEFWGSTSSAVKPKAESERENTSAVGHAASPTSGPSQNQAVRQMVGQAFDRSDSIGSMSKQDGVRTQTMDSNVSTGTSDISPILNRLDGPPLATAANSKPLPPLKGLEAINKDAPLPPPPAIESTTSSRSASPSKGRVRDLASQFNDIADSRRSSVHSVGSRKSIHEVKPAESAGSQSAEIVNAGQSMSPIVAKGLETRPKIPGQWDSFNSPAATPATEKQLPTTFGRKEEKSDVLPLLPTQRNEAASTSDIDLIPTSTKQVLDGKDHNAQTSALAALSSAGAAMGEAIRKSVGLEDHNGASPVSPVRAVGDVHNSRPLAPQRLDTSATDTSEASESPPPPPAKHEDMAPPVPLKGSGVAAEPAPLRIGASKAPVSNISSDDSPDDFESDRLRREIVRSLSPPPADEISRNIAEEKLPMKESMAGNGVSPISAETPKPNFLNKRFSWETSNTSAAASAHLDPVSPISAQHTPVQTSLRPDVALGTALAEDDPRLGGEALHVINTEPGEERIIQPSTKALDVPLASAPTSRFSDTTAQDSTPRDSASSGGAVALATLAGGAAVAAGAAAIGTTSRPGTPSDKTDTKTLQPQSYLPSFREIQAIKSPGDRITTYNSTRTKWADMNSGLNSWLTQTLEKYPEHAGLKHEASLPFVSTSFNNSAGPHSRIQAGHMKTGSIGKIFTSMGATGPSENSGQTADYLPEVKEKRSSATGAGKAVGETLKGLGGKGKGLLGKMGRGRLRGGGNGDGDSPLSSPSTSTFKSSLPQSRSDVTLPHGGIGEAEFVAPKNNKRSSRSFSPFSKSRPTSVLTPGTRDGEIPYLPPSPIQANRTRRASWIESAKDLMRTPTKQSGRSGPKAEHSIEDVRTPTQDSHTRDLSDVPERSIVDHRPSGEDPEDVKTPTAPIAPKAVVQTLSKEGLPSSSDDLASNTSRRSSSSGPLKDAEDKPTNPAYLLGKNRVVSMILPSDDLGVHIGGDDGGVSPIEDENEDEDAHSKHSEMSGRNQSISQISRSRASTDTWERASAVSEPGSQAQTSTPSHADSLHDHGLPDHPTVPTLESGNIKSASTVRVPVTEETSRHETAITTPHVDSNAIKSGITQLPKSSKEKQPADEDKNDQESDQSFKAGQDDHISLSVESPRDDAEKATVENEFQAPQKATAIERQIEGPTALDETLPIAPQRPSMTVTHVDNSQDVSGPSPNSAQPSEVSVESETDRFLRPKASIGARSMPSISSMGHGTDRSEDQSPVDAVAPAISPVRSQFETREYNPPNPQLERPMSFVPLPRDSSGQLHEHISTSRPDIESRRSSRRISRGDGAVRRSSRLLGTLHGPRGSTDGSDPGQEPRREVSPIRIALSDTPVRYEEDEVQSNERVMPQVQRPDNQVQTREPLSAKPGKFGSLFSRHTPSPVRESASEHRPTSSQRDASSSHVVNQPYTPTEVVDPHDADAEKRKRRSGGFLQPFKRNPSTGADSLLTHDNSSIIGQAGDSPTRQQYLLNPNMTVGTLPPPVTITARDSQQGLQRASTSGGPEPKKKRFSALGSLFGRSGTTGHSTKLGKKQPPASTVIHRVPQNPNNPPSQYPQPGYYPVPVPPGQMQHGGYYAPHPPPQLQNPPGWQHGPGASGFTAIQQQQQQQQPPPTRSSRRQSRHAQDPRMGSISEQHQERPWNLNIPAAGDQAADREIIGREIMFAAERRWNPMSPMSQQGPHQQAQFVTIQGHQVLLNPQQLWEYQQFQLQRQQQQQQQQQQQPQHQQPQHQHHQQQHPQQHPQQQGPAYLPSPNQGPPGQGTVYSAPQQIQPSQQSRMGSQHQPAPLQQAPQPQAQTAQYYPAPSQQAPQQPRQSAQYQTPTAQQAPQQQAQSAQYHPSQSQQAPQQQRQPVQYQTQPAQQALQQQVQSSQYQNLPVQQAPQQQAQSAQYHPPLSQHVPQQRQSAQYRTPPVQQAPHQQSQSAQYETLPEEQDLQPQVQSPQYRPPPVQQEAKQPEQRAPESAPAQQPEQVQQQLVQAQTRPRAHSSNSVSSVSSIPAPPRYYAQQRPQPQTPQDTLQSPHASRQSPDPVQIPPLQQDHIPILQPRPQHPGSKLKYEPPSLGKAKLGATIPADPKMEGNEPQPQVPQQAIPEQGPQGDVATSNNSSVSYHPPPLVQRKAPPAAVQKGPSSLDEIPTQSTGGHMMAPSDVPPRLPPKIPLPQVNTQVQQIQRHSDILSPSQMPLPPSATAPTPPSFYQRDVTSPTSIPLPQSATSPAPQNWGPGNLTTISESSFPSSRDSPLPPSYSQQSATPPSNSHSPAAFGRVPIIQIPTAPGRAQPRSEFSNTSVPQADHSHLPELPGSAVHRRNPSTLGTEDDAPVMKAVSYPGDEWIPRWDGD